MRERIRFQIWKQNKLARSGNGSSSTSSSGSGNCNRSRRKSSDGRVRE